MTYSVIPALRTQPELAAEWEPRFLSLDYDGERIVPAPDKAGRALRHGDDREAGRLRRARQHDHRAAAERRRPRRRVRAHRPQVVLLGADVRRVPRPRPGRGRRLLLPDAALHARRRAQPRSTSSGSRTSSATAPTPPARSSSAAPGRGSSARRAAACRRSSRWSTTPGSTARSASPPGCACGAAKAIHHAAHRSAFGKLLDRPAADAERARRPRGRVRGGDDLVDAPGARLRRGDRRRRARRQQFKRLANAVLKYWICKRGAGARGRGARVPRRQRLRRGVGHAAALPRDRR